MRVLPIIIAILLPLTMFAQVKEVVLNESFADNGAGWPEDYTDDYSASVNAGTYYLVHKRNSGSKIFDVPIRMYLGENYYIEMDGKCNEGSAEGGYGIVWGKGRGGYFAFVITPGGRFFVRKMKAGEAGKFLLGPKSCPYIHKVAPVEGVKGAYTKPYNKIRVQYSNDELMFFINDHYVGHIPNERYFGNNAGVILYGRQNVEIKKFGAFGTKIYERVKDYSAAMRVITYEIEDGVEPNGERLGNGDCRVSPGETIRLAVTMKNQGYGKCDGLKATFYSVGGHVTVIDQDVPQYLNDLDRNESQILDLKFKVSPSCPNTHLYFRIDLTDSNDKLAESVPMTVVLNNPITPIHREGDGTISFTLNLRESDTHDINAGLPFTMNNADNTYVVIVAVEGYQRLPKAKYAVNDAKIFYNYLVKVLNVPRNNILYAINQKATLKDVVDIFKVRGLLQSRAYGKQGIDLIFYFTGLGVCGNNGMEPCLMLYDSNTANPVETGYPLSSLLKALHSYDIHSLICFFDTSFAGVDRDGASFVSPGSSIISNAAFPMVTDQRTCLMYASGSNLPNPVVDNTSHGMFTHYLLSTLKNYAQARSYLDMKRLYEQIYQNMEREGNARRISIYPRMDCQNVDGIRLLK